MNERRVYLAQLKCPKDHCIVALAGVYDNDEEAKILAEFVREQFNRAASTGVVDRFCGICGSEQFHVDLGRTIWKTMEEAKPLLQESEKAQIISAAQMKANRN